MRDHVDPCRCSREAFFAGYAEGFGEGIREGHEQTIRWLKARNALLTQARDEGGTP